MIGRLYKNISRYPYLVILSVFFLSTILLWLPFIVKVDMLYGIHTPHIGFDTILKHWDGLLYVITAKTWYNITDPIITNSPLGLTPNYFTAHLPLYPFTIRILSPLFGYPKAMIASTIIAGSIFFTFFYYFVSRLQLTKKPLLLTLVLLFFTPRFFIIRATPTPEPLFMLLILSSVFFYVQKKYLYAGMLGGIAIATKTPAGLLFVAYAVDLFLEYIRTRTFKKEWLGIALIPCGLLGVFTLYKINTGDFFAYFNSGDNIHLLFPPFQVFNYQKLWVGTAWLEEVYIIFAFYAFAIIHMLLPSLTQARGIINLFNHVWGKITHSFSSTRESFKRISLIFTIVFFLAIISVQHKDISRYSLPLLPFAVISLESFFTSKKFVLVLILLLPALYIYGWNFLLFNIAPITDWRPFL